MILSCLLSIHKVIGAPNQQITQNFNLNNQDHVSFDEIPYDNNDDDPSIIAVQTTFLDSLPELQSTFKNTLSLETSVTESFGTIADKIMEIIERSITSQYKTQPDKPKILEDLKTIKSLRVITPTLMKLLNIFFNQDRPGEIDPQSINFVSELTRQLQNGEIPIDRNSEVNSQKIQNNIAPAVPHTQISDNTNNLRGFSAFIQEKQGPIQDISQNELKQSTNIHHSTQLFENNRNTNKPLRTYVRVPGLYEYTVYHH